MRNSEILYRLLGIGSYDTLLSNPTLGKSWEGFVIENIHCVLPKLAQTFFYRTATGAEIDLVIKMPNGEVWAIEIRYGHSPKISKHYNQTCKDVSATHKFVVYSGNDEFPISNNVQMISLPKIMKKFSKLQGEQ